MWQIDPSIYLAGDGENRNPAVADYYVKIEMPEDYTAASAGTITAQNGIISIELKNIPALLLSIFRPERQRKSFVREVYPLA